MPDEPTCATPLCHEAEASGRASWRDDGPAEDAASVAAIRHAIERGIPLIDTGDFYGNGHNELLSGSAASAPRPSSSACAGVW